MQAFQLIFGSINILSGIVYIIVSIPLYNGSVKINRWYGFRTSTSMKSSSNWYKINMYGAKKLIFYSVILFILGLATFSIPNFAITAILSAAPLIAAIITGYQTWIYSKSL